MGNVFADLDPLPTDDPAQQASPTAGVTMPHEAQLSVRKHAPPAASSPPPSDMSQAARPLLYGALAVAMVMAFIL